MTSEVALSINEKVNKKSKKIDAAIKVDVDTKQDSLSLFDSLMAKAKKNTTLKVKEESTVIAKTMERSYLPKTPILLFDKMIVEVESKIKQKIHKDDIKIKTVKESLLASKFNLEVFEKINSKTETNTKTNIKTKINSSEAIKVDPKTNENIPNNQIVKHTIVASNDSKSITKKLNMDISDKDIHNKVVNNIQEIAVDKSKSKNNEAKVTRVDRVGEVVSKPSTKQILFSDDVLIVPKDEVKNAPITMFDTMIGSVKKDKSLNVISNNIKDFEKKDIIKQDANFKIPISDKISVKDDIVTSIFLSTQKKSFNEKIIQNKDFAINIVKNGTSIKDITKSAEVLDLNVKDIKVESLAKEIKKDYTSSSSASSLERLIFNQKIAKIDTSKISNIMNNMQHNIQNNIQNNNIIKLEDINLQVHPVLANGISSKIVEAKQQLSSMMSDIARKMYENYKPPVTAFKINLLPSALGSIAIVMKSNKSSGLSISLNMSNSSTLDAMIDSQTILRTALSKNFSDTNLSLNFNMKDESSHNESKNFDDNQDKQKNKEESKTNVTNFIHIDTDIDESDNKYM